MSHAATRWAWEIGIENTNDLIVLLCLADHADDTGTCWPGMPRIQQKTGLSESAVYRALRSLDEGGLLIRTPAAPGKRVMYQLDMPSPARNVEAPPTPGCQRDGNGRTPPRRHARRQEDCWMSTVAPSMKCSPSSTGAGHEKCGGTAGSSH
jgi:DNA-binding transcriptional ArsR family regulator